MRISLEKQSFDNVKIKRIFSGMRAQSRKNKIFNSWVKSLLSENRKNLDSRKKRKKRMHGITYR